MVDQASNKIIAKCSTWFRDSHMLFDYEHKEMTRKFLEIRGNAYLSRIDNEVVDSNDPGNDCLLYVSVKDLTFTVSAFPPYPMWKVIRSVKGSSNPQQHPLVQGTVIKLGRLQFEVKMLKTNNDFLESVSVKRVADETLTCRICFIEDQETDPLISVCKCLGSIQYIHLNCLRSWILSKLTPGEETPELKFLKTIHCELCREKLPILLTIEGKEFDMLARFKPKVPFLILEGLQSEQREPGVYFIGFSDKSNVMLGRGHDSDVRIPDISVSRCHAKIVYKKGDFFIEDNSSKFGTLVRVDNDTEVEDSIIVQCGRSVIELNRNISEQNTRFYWEDS